MHDKGCIVPTILPYSVEFDFDDNRVVFAACAMQSLLHFSSLQEVITWKLLIREAFHISKSFIEDPLSI